MVRRVIIAILLFVGIAWLPCSADNQPYDPPRITDNYDIRFGTDQVACLGDPAFFVPINATFSRPTVRIALIITYDPTVITPTLLAPNIFLQSFTYDLSVTGRIKVTMVTDLPPPPEVPPIYGDTTVAWISFRITTRDMNWDITTHFNFYEDPTTPYRDNLIVLNDNTMIVPPYLVLHQGDLVLKHPLYGDINLNTYPFEIADAVLFLNYIVGRAHLNQCQLANSDCNRDGVQATIADVVYMLNVINYDSTLMVKDPDMPVGGVEWKPSATALGEPMAAPTGRSYDFVLDGCDAPLGGAAFVIDLADSAYIPDAIVLDSSAQHMRIYCTVEGNLLRIAVINWDGLNDSFRGGRLFSIIYSDLCPTPPFKVESSDFSDNRGQSIEVNYNVTGVEQRGEAESMDMGSILSGYPNPFNGAVAINFNLPQQGGYNLTVYDILGRKVKVLLDGERPAGFGNVIWDARDEAGDYVSSGTYFVRLRGSDLKQTYKLFYLK